MTGTVKWFNEKRGFGFVTREDGEGDVFVHYTGIQAEGFRNLRPAEVVTFDLDVSDSRGPRAINVRLASDGAQEKE